MKNLEREINKPITKSEGEIILPDLTETNEFSFQQLEVLWKNYLQRYKEKGLASECLILDRQIQLDGENIVIRLDNVIQIDQLNNFKMDLLEYLRKTLKNGNINIVSHIKEESEIKKIYTGKEKYLFLAAQNPAIDELRLKLGLDLIS